MIKNKNSTIYSLIIIVASVIIVLWAALFPSGWNWGFHFLAFYNIDILIACLILILLFSVPKVQDYFIEQISLLCRSFNKLSKTVRIMIMPVSLAGLVLILWTFRERSFLLGDGQLILRSMESSNSIAQLIYGFRREPLVAFIVIILSNIFIFLKHLNPVRDAYIWLSIISGVVFVITAWQIVKYYAKEKIERLLIFVLLISTGISQLFFGYVENYSCSAAGVLLFLLLGAAYLREKISIVWIIPVYGITLLLNLGTLIFLPVIVFLVYIAAKRRHIFEFGASLFLTAVIVYILLQLSQYSIGMILTILNGSEKHLVPIFSPVDSSHAYSMFSFSHIIDVLNFLILCYPAILFILVFAGITLWKISKPITNEHKFLLMAAICSITFIFIINCELGMSRDWDILAPISLGIPVAAIAFWNTAEIEINKRYRILIILCAISLLQTGLWIGVNSDEKKAENRVKILENDHLWSKHARLDAYEELAIYERNKNNYEDELQYYLKYIKLDSTNRRILGNLAKSYETTDRKMKALEIYRKMIKLGMADYQILSNIGVIYNELKLYDEAMSVFKKAEEDAPQDPIVKYNIGITILTNKKDYKKAIPFFLDAIRLNPAYQQAYSRAAECYYMLGDSASLKNITLQYQSLQEEKFP